jgi:hypothetical protein
MAHDPSVPTSKGSVTMMDQMELLPEDIFLLHYCHSIFESAPVLCFLAHAHGSL